MSLPAERTLSTDEHVAIQNRLQLVSQAALSFEDGELEAFIRAGERAETFGPILDPTLFIQGSKQLAVVLEHARALAQFRRVLRDER